MDKEKNDVFIGKNGVLFLKNGNHFQMDYLIGEKVPSAESIKYFKENILGRKTFCSKRNIKYSHLVFPSKPLVMDKYLPNEYVSVASLYNTYYDIDDSSIIYPLNELKEKEEKYSTFIKLDTHNNARGMVIILNLLLDKLHIDRVVLSEVSTEQEYKGDLSIMLKGSSLPKEDILVELMPTYNETYIYSNANDINGNEGMVVIATNHKAKNNKKILIFGDSFFLGIVALLSNIFTEVLFVRSATFYKEYIEQFQPDIVFTGNAERYFPSTKLENINDSHINKVLSENYNKEFIEIFRSVLSLKDNDFTKNKEFEKYKEISFPLNVYAFITYYATGEFRELHYGLFHDANDDLIKAQKNSTDLLFKYLHHSPAKILEVGIGLGKTHQKLIDKGFECTGITPDAAQIEIVKESITDANLVCTRLEDFNTDEKFDIILFQESAQYIETEDIFDKAAQLLKDDGRILIVDEFSIGETALHEIRQFKKNALNFGFELVESKDLSSLASPTEDYILKSLEEYREDIQETLDLKPEMIDHLVEAVLEHKVGYKKKTRGYFFLEFKKRKKALSPTIEDSSEIKKKRALVLTKLPLNALGGIEKIAQNIVDLLHDYGWEVESKNSQDFYEQPQMKYLQKKSGNLFDYFAPESQSDWQSYDLVITNNFFAGTLYNTNTTKVITLVHGLFTAVVEQMKDDIPGIKEQFKNELMIEDMAYRNKSKLIAIVKHVHTDLNKYLGADSILIYNGFDFDHFSTKTQDLRKKYNIGHDAIVGLYAGRWSIIEKRPDIILNLTKIFPNIIWVFAIDKDISKECKEAKTLNNIVVIQTIPYEEMPNLYAMVDFCIQLSFYEGISNFAMESLASKTPMVSTNVSILPEVYPGTKLEDLLIEQSFDRAIVLERAENKVQVLLDDLALYKEESENIWIECKNKFSLEKWKKDIATELELN